MANSLEAVIRALSQGPPDAGYEVGTPEFHNGTLFIPLTEKGIDLEDAIRDFNDTIGRAVSAVPPSATPTIHVAVGYDGASITLSPSTNAGGNILGNTQKFLEAYKGMLDGRDIRTVISSILAAPKGISPRRSKSVPRTETQIYQDIANSIHQQGGRASTTRISSAANLGFSRSADYLERMINLGYISEVIPNNRRGSAYELTDYGKSTFQDPGVRNGAHSRRHRGEVLMNILGLTQQGASKTGLANGAHISSERINDYISFLLKYGLISQSNAIFKTTGAYDAMDKEILPYALDLMYSKGPIYVLRGQRTPQLIQLDILRAASKPNTINNFIKSFGGSNAAYAPQIKKLQEGGRLEGIDSGKSMLYQRTPAGKEFLDRVDAAVSKLGATAQRVA